uniref:Uncharacterized protein n=1 Tax=Parascaris univalens TaxID=6257 RepID=A0A915A9P5_PARUN
MAGAVEEEFARQFERTDPHWRNPQKRPLSNYNSQCDISANSIVIAPLPQVVRESGFTGYESKPLQRKYRPRKMCCVANITVCIVLVTILALLLIGAVIAVIVVVVKHGGETTTETTTTTTTTPSPLRGYLNTTKYDVSIKGNPRYIASFDIDPGKPDSFIAVDNSLHVVYLFSINDLIVREKFLLLDDSAYMENCTTFTMKSFCLSDICGENDVTYCAEGCPNSTDFCKMGDLKVSGSSPYICAAHASFTDKNGVAIDVCTKNSDPSCSIELVRLYNYTDTFRRNRSSCAVGENNFPSGLEFATLTTVGSVEEIDWMVAVDANGSISAVRLKDGNSFTTASQIHSDQTKLYVTYVDQNDVQVIAVDGTRVTFYRFGNHICPVFYGEENLILHDNSRLAVSSDGTIYVISQWPNSTSLYQLHVHRVIWK